MSDLKRIKVDLMDMFPDPFNQPGDWIFIPYNDKMTAIFNLSNEECRRRYNGLPITSYMHKLKLEGYEKEKLTSMEEYEFDKLFQVGMGVGKKPYILRVDKFKSRFVEEHKIYVMVLIDPEHQYVVASEDPVIQFMMEKKNVNYELDKVDKIKRTVEVDEYKPRVVEENVRVNEYRAPPPQPTYQKYSDTFNEIIANETARREGIAGRNGIAISTHKWNLKNNMVGDGTYSKDDFENTIIPKAAKEMGKDRKELDDMFKAARGEI
jgi:hypothetical protein